MKKIVHILLVIGLVWITTSCGSFKKYKMFTTDSSILVDSIERLRNSSTSDYTIEINDVISLDVYTNNGEKLIDPNNALPENMGATKEPAAPIQYTIHSDGTAYLPMIGSVYLKGFTVFQADSILSLKYNAYYTAPFVKVKLLSKRVIVFGPDGGKIIPLEYQDMNLIEVIARYGGIKTDGKANNIRVLRGDLRNPDVQLIDLGTIEGLRLAYTDMHPGDIVYIEPHRSAFKESMTTIFPLASLITSLATLLVVFRSL
jgi:polysaccharide biosynthesis/export protein